MNFLSRKCLFYMRKNIKLYVFILIQQIIITYQQQVTITNGVIQQNIYQFLSSNQNTNKFTSVVDRITQMCGDATLSQLLSGAIPVGPSNTPGSTGGITVFVPVNDALNNLATDSDQLRNDISNLMVKDRLTIDQLRSMNGQNITRTFGYRPRLFLRTVKNFYSRQLHAMNESASSSGRMVRSQTASTTVSPSSTRRSPRQVVEAQVSNDSANVYELFVNAYGAGDSSYDGPKISLKFPQDELFLINDAIILDRFELTNGVVYLLNSYPRYYEKSLLSLLQDGDVTGLAQNLNFWVTRAAQSFRLGDENLRNALNAYGPNTYFLPTDQAFNNFNMKDLLNNMTILFDVFFKSHRVSNQLLFDNYLDDANGVFTDTGLSVSTVHRRNNGRDEIEISIGHVKGRIIPEFRNIYCASGIIHLVDTVLGIPMRNAYQEITNTPELSSFKSLIDSSTKYRQLLDQNPTTLSYPSRPRRQTQDQYYTVLAPNEHALLAIKDQLVNNATLIDEFLSNHIIVDSGSNRVFYTDHDDSIFQSGQTYSTLNPSYTLVANVQQNPYGGTNKVTLQVSQVQSIKTTIVSGNSRVSNGVIHIVDKQISHITANDITSLLDRYANNQGGPLFNQFVDALRSTGIFNDLNQPSKKYTLFIPTNQALSSYQDIINSGDLEKKKQLVYRHICLDQNLQSTYLTNSSNTPTTDNMDSQNQLICRNALGQDVTLTKDSNGLISKWQGMASSKILNDFPGLYSSAYVLESTLVNNNLTNLGLVSVNSANKISIPGYSALLALIALLSRVNLYI